MHTILSGIDSLDTITSRLAGRRVGLMTNPTGLNHSFASTIDLLNAHASLTALFSVEHGIRGDVQAGEAYAAGTDSQTGLPVYAVYGGTHRLTPEMLDTFDVLCFDIQDVGARFYTYLYALSFAMEECAAAGKELIVFDRLNPLGGDRIEGTVLDERFASYVGMYALPTRYGMTIGEYARWVRAYLHLDLELTVVPLKGWHRGDDPEDLDVPWVAPSPNCATFHAARAYIGTCIFEGTNLSEGRGTTMPFEYIGAPFLDPYALASAVNAQNLPGLCFRPVFFTPTFSKHAGEACRGVQLHITDRRAADVILGALTLLDEVRRRYPSELTFIRSGEGYFIDKLLGTDTYRLGQHDARSLLSAHAEAREAFREARRPYLLYD